MDFAKSSSGNLGGKEKLYFLIRVNSCVKMLVFIRGGTKQSSAQAQAAMPKKYQFLARSLARAQRDWVRARFSFENLGSVPSIKEVMSQITSG